MPASRTIETVGELRKRFVQLLERHSETPWLDVDLLLGVALSKTRLQLVTWPDQPLSTDEVLKAESLISRRLAGEPIAYILGYKEFRRIRLSVDRRVLVPRPETEQMVDIALEWIDRQPSVVRVVDVGTGSGAIALVLADETRHIEDRLRIVATDVSAAALAVAAENRNKLELNDRVRLRQGVLLEGCSEQFDLVLANLPYLRPDQRHWSTQREPGVALNGGRDGFDLYRQLIAQLPQRLASGGLFVAEIDPAQAELGRREVESKLGLPSNIVKDLARVDRFLLAGTFGEL